MTKQDNLSKLPPKVRKKVYKLGVECETAKPLRRKRILRQFVAIGKKYELEF